LFVHSSLDFREIIKKGGRIRKIAAEASLEHGPWADNPPLQSEKLETLTVNINKVFIGA
jgi:hypothetical protein